MLLSRGDHAKDGATLLVRAVDEILGTHSSCSEELGAEPSEWMSSPGYFVATISYPW